MGAGLNSCFTLQVLRVNLELRFEERPHTATYVVTQNYFSLRTPRNKGKQTRERQRLVNA